MTASLGPHCIMISSEALAFCELKKVPKTKTYKQVDANTKPFDIGVVLLVLKTVFKRYNNQFDFTCISKLVSILKHRFYILLDVNTCVSLCIDFLNQMSFD